VHKIFYLLSSVGLFIAVAVAIWYIQQPKTGPLGENTGVPFQFKMTMFSTVCVAVYCLVRYLQSRKNS